ncbi:choice-of-anchor D domain-containing protein [Halobacteriovorax sp. YZS-1-1]|uniref:choice-of-anchor D domain-containing protein n=1 Tax=unclassified Halobacteriovorax TaxID=2639665 RepID=UPI00399B8A06
MVRMLYILTFITLLVSSCTPVEKASETASILNDGVYKPVEFEIIGGLERGEFLLGGSGDDIYIRIKNNTTYNLTDVALNIDENSSAAVKFFPEDDGNVASPGFGGTCGVIVTPGQECTFRLFYGATVSGSHTQPLDFVYKTLVDEYSVTKSLSFFTGTAASLVFAEDEINYSFGVVERTEPEVLRKTLVVRNAGELTARGIAITKNDNTASGAFTMLNNTCGMELKSEETCQFDVEFIPKNYGVGAPDGNVDLDYTSNIRFDYNRDPEGGISALNVYFDAVSTTIEGRIAIGGLPNLEFEDIVVGNLDDLTIKITNKGYKEAIISSIDIRDPSNNLVARCIRDGSALLSCRSPLSDLTDPANELSLPDNPFKITDTANCVTDVSTIGYSRNPDGTLDTAGIREVGGRTIEAPGESCFFNIVFHPSVTFETDGNFNNYKLNVRFDSTWKDGIHIFNDQSSDENNFWFDVAEYYSAAKLSFDNIEYRDLTYTNQDPTDNDLFEFNLGRVSLIADSNYKSRMKIRVLNTGTTVGEITSVSDGASPTPNTITESSYHFNTYYQNVKHSNCEYLAGGNGQCDILFDLNPLASSNPDSAAAELEENGAMYDHMGVFPDRYKIFRIKYTDGTTYNDDMSLRSEQEIEMRLKALLVRKGFLAFSDYSMTAGTTMSIPATTDTKYFHMKLENVGTGGITYINMRDPINFPGHPSWSPSASTNQRPYRIIDNPTSALISGADKDCYDILDFGGMNGPVSVTPGNNAPSLLSPGEICTLTFEIKRNSVDKIGESYYNNADRRWLREFDTDTNGTNDARTFNSNITGETNFSFEFYDGDGIADAATGYTPSLSGHGGLSATSQYPMRSGSRSPARLVPDAPEPMISALLWRQAISLPSQAPLAGEWGNTLAATTMPAMYRDLSKNQAAPPISYALSNSINRIAPELDTSFDYVFYGGTYYANETNVVSMRLSNSGVLPARSLSYSITGDSEITLNQTTGFISGNSQGILKLNFAPTAPGLYLATVDVDYLDSSQTLIDRDTYSYNDNIKTLTISVVLEAVAATNGRLSVTSQPFEVLYDEATDSHTENLLPDSSSHILKMNELDTSTYAVIEAVRGSRVYAKTRFFAENTGSTTITDLNFNIKTGAGASVHANISGGLGYILESSTCTGPLAPGATCYFDIKHNASLSEPNQTTRVGVLSYDLGSDQYYSEMFQIEFLAVDPAKVEIGSISTNNIVDENGGFIQDAFPIDIGFYDDTNHPLLTTYPGGTVVKNVNLQNPKAEKASFLKQYRNYVGDQNAVIPAGVYHTIYNTGSIQIEANRACFYGDDEGGPLSVDEWGFNQSTGANCIFRITYNFDESYVGQKIPESENYAVLEYYDSKRASSTTMPIYITGFVEPNRSSVGDDSITNVSVTSEGEVYLEWEAFTPSNINWGSILRYRVFYSQLSNSFDNIFDASGVDYFDTVGNETYITLTGLAPSRFHYIYIAAVRQTPGGTEYLSVAPTMTTKEIVVPDETAIYDYESKMIIDRYALPYGSGVPDFANKESARQSCATSSRTIKKQGVNRTKYKSLIDYNDYLLINSDSNNSDYMFYAFPHWLDDEATDVEPLFSPDFNCSETSKYNSVDNIMYVKDCDTCACNILSMIVGGDMFPMDSVVYTYDDFNGAARCKIKQSDF